MVRERQTGYTYLALLLAIVLLGAGFAGTAVLWSVENQREREKELLHIGHKFREALGRYYHSTPGAVKQYPPTLEALLQDDRYPVPRRYLREIYADPFTGMRNWGIVEAPSGGIMGVYSLSTSKAFKRANFRPVNEFFTNKAYVHEWIFVHIPEQ
jgi:type II secretory pathway pseudopilin PulG